MHIPCLVMQLKRRQIYSQDFYIALLRMRKGVEDAEFSYQF